MFGAYGFGQGYFGQASLGGTVPIHVPDLTQYRTRLVAATFGQTAMATASVLHTGFAFAPMDTPQLRTRKVDV